GRRPWRVAPSPARGGNGICNASIRCCPTARWTRPGAPGGARLRGRGPGGRALPRRARLARGSAVPRGRAAERRGGAVAGDLAAGGGGPGRAAARVADGSPGGAQGLERRRLALLVRRHGRLPGTERGPARAGGPRADLWRPVSAGGVYLPVRVPVRALVLFARRYAARSCTVWTYDTPPT